MTDIVDERRALAARISLTQQIDRESVVLSSRLAAAFLNVPRHPFVPSSTAATANGSSRGTAPTSIRTRG